MALNDDSIGAAALGELDVQTTPTQTAHMHVEISVSACINVEIDSASNVAVEIAT